MSAKNCLVVVHMAYGDPIVVSDPKTTYFSKKDAQRKAVAMLAEFKEGASSVEVLETVLTVRHPGIDKRP